MTQWEGIAKIIQFLKILIFGLRLYKAGFHMSVLRETLFVYSLRRYRNEGKLKVMQQYAKGAIVGLFTKTALKSMPGYIMGGQLYGKRKHAKESVLKQYEKNYANSPKSFFLKFVFE